MGVGVECGVWCEFQVQRSHFNLKTERDLRSRGISPWILVAEDDGRELTRRT